MAIFPLCLHIVVPLCVCVLMASFYEDTSQIELGPTSMTSFKKRLLIWLCWILVGASLVAQMVKSPPAVWETWVQSLGWEAPLEKGMATHSSILAWRIPWTEETGRLQSIVS